MPQIDYSNFLEFVISAEPRQRRRAFVLMQRAEQNACEGAAPDDQFDRMKQAQRDVVEQSLEGLSTPVSEYIGRLAAFLVEANDERMRLYKEEDARVKRVTDRINRRMELDPSRENHERQRRRMRKVICAGCDSKNSGERQQIELMHAFLLASSVFGLLGKLVLTNLPALRRLLNTPHQGHVVFYAAAELGAAAKALAPDLIAQLNRMDSVLADAVAAVSRDDAALIAQVVDRLDSDDASVIAAAGAAIERMGPAAATAYPPLVARLLASADRTNATARCWAAWTLARVTRGTDIAIDRLLDLTGDADPYVRGAALSALGIVARESERVVPRLIEALDTFEEADHDVDGDRVVNALAEFGPAAAPALPKLIERLNDEYGVNESVLGAFKAMGAAAAPALPRLKELAKQWPLEPDDEPDLLRSTIASIEQAMVE